MPGSGEDWTAAPGRGWLVETVTRIGTAAVFWLALSPAPAVSQGFPIEIPKSLVFPNYDNVLLGKEQALEGGAYLARTGDASANFYNPAGLVQSAKTA